MDGGGRSSAELGPGALLADPLAGHASLAVFRQRPGAAPARVLGSHERRRGASSGAPAGGPPVGECFVAQDGDRLADAGVEAARALAVPGPQGRAEDDLGLARLRALHALAED